MDVDRIASRAKPLVAAILRSPLHPLLSFGLLLISFEGRRTGRRYSFPVGYQQRGETITVLASRARRKSWWRNPVEARFRRLPRLAGQFGIAYERGQRISEEQWRNIVAEGPVVKIELLP